MVLVTNNGYYLEQSSQRLVCAENTCLHKDKYLKSQPIPGRAPLPY